MIRKLLDEEHGYSLVEVMVSIFILATAIIPMVGMLDMSLTMVTRSGNYDTARAFAVQAGLCRQPFWRVYHRQCTLHPPKSQCGQLR